MLCEKCKYDRAHGMSGQGFTPYTCEKCGQVYYWHNTNKPKVCLECSEKYNICEHCGEPLDE